MADLQEPGCAEEISPSLWPEDTVEYRIHCSPDALKPGGGGEVSPASSLGDALSRLAVDCNYTCKCLSGSHVWHYTAMALRPDITGDSPCLVGRTCFGDSIHDEWFIVQILLALSKEWPDFVISVQDGDGQFLLIEAAHCLEPWMRPEEMKNRVFLHSGCVHIIPKPRSPAEIGVYPVTTPTLSEAVRLVRDETIDTAASQQLQLCINRRLASSEAVTVLHHAHCYLPSLAAHVLAQDPQLVSAACHALSDRSPADMQVCRKMAIFSPTRHTMVTARVKFTRLLYAQILRMQFSGAKGSGFSVPANSRSARFKECDLGMKLTCGLEILYHQAKARGCDGNPICAEDSPNWPLFLQRLKEWDYFSSELEGSEKYQEKLCAAKEFFLGQNREKGGEGGGGSKESFLDNEDPLISAGQKIVQIVENQSSSFSEEELQQMATELPPPDDDGWLNITESDLDQMLQQTVPCPSKPPSHLHSPPANISLHAESASSASPTPSGQGKGADLHSMIYGMQSFVDKKSTHEGAEFPWSGDSTTAVDFDPDLCLEKIVSMLDVNSNRGNLQDPGSDEDDDDDGGDLESLSDGSLDGKVKGDGEELQELMEMMDEQLAGTSVGRSFERTSIGECPDAQVKDGEDCEPLGDGDDVSSQPVDVNFNLVKNLLDSYSSQGGMAGPASNILHSLGIRIPDN